ncbi:hypothetical protein A6R68_19460, partial [Neotoma lepida]
MWFLGDTNCSGVPGPHDDAEVTKSINTTRDMNGTDLQFSERTCNIICLVESPQDGNTGYENGKNITLRSYQLHLARTSPRRHPYPLTRTEERAGKGKLLALLINPRKQAYLLILEQQES